MTAPFLSVFVAVNSATMRASAKSGISVALISVAMDVEVAVSALNHYRYGSARAKAKGSNDLVIEKGWNDWRLATAPPNDAIRSDKGSFAEGWMSIPIGHMDIAKLARRLEDLLRPRRLDIQCASCPITIPRYVPTDDGIRTSPIVDDLYVFDPASDGEWLAAIVEKAVEDARGEGRPAHARSRSEKKS